MKRRPPVTPGDLLAAIENVVSTLRTGTDRDWSTPAATLDWDCRHTTEHIGDCLLSYAGQLTVEPRERYVPFMAHADTDAPPEGLLEFVLMGGRVLASVVRTSPAGARAYHPTGLADREGFMGMGCVEVLVHGHDVATGLGLELDPPREVCARVLDRMFPEQAASAADAEDDPWAVLRWATGRTDLPGRPAPASWRWRGAPLDDPPVTSTAPASPAATAGR